MLIKPKTREIVIYLCFLLVINNIIQKCNIQSAANLPCEKEAIVLFIFVYVQVLISLQNKHKNIVFVILIINPNVISDQ